MKKTILLFFTLTMSMAGFANEKGPSVQRMYSEYDYPVLPENFEDIIGGTTTNLCNQIQKGVKEDMLFIQVMNQVKKHYKGGDVNDFFYKYVLTLKCWPGVLNFYDGMTKDGYFFSDLYATVMRGMFGGINPNAFIRIEREGKLFEGPIHIVYKHLYENYKESKHYKKEYLGVMKRLAREHFLSENPESMAEIRREDPDMPLTLPMP